MGKPVVKRPLGMRNIKTDLQERRFCGEGAWTGLIWLRIGISGRSL